MSNTYTQIHIHLIFAVKYRMGLINKDWEQNLHNYIISMTEKHHHKVLAIGGMNDHVHLFFGMRPTQSLSDLVQEVKRTSSLWINENRFCIGKFAWQEGYGGFSYAKSQIDNVVKYILNQKEHHTNTPFLVEYKEFLDKFGVEYDEKYIFQELI